MARSVVPPGFYGDAERDAHQLFLQGWSLRDIADRVLPGRSGGFVTVSRWSRKPDAETGLTWQQEKAQLAAAQREADRQKYLEMVSEIKDKNLQIAKKAMTAVSLALDDYFVYDGDDTIVGVKTNPKTGLPMISPRDMAPLINAMTELQNKTLGLESLTPDEATATALPEERRTVEADPVLSKAIGDYLALRALESPPVPESGNPTQSASPK